MQNVTYFLHQLKELCKTKRPCTYSEKVLFKKALGIDAEYTYEAKGCDKCHNGYTGRIALQEVLVINDEIREAINNNVSRDELKKEVYQGGVKTLLQDGLIKVLGGSTDIKEVLKLVEYDESGFNKNQNKDEDIPKESKNVFEGLREDE